MSGFPIRFRCPACLAAIEHSDVRCAACGNVLQSREGVLDFVRADEVSDERDFYDREYVTLDTAGTKASIDTARPTWDDPWQPQNQLVWNALGDIRDKRILLLGNGHSTKELWLLSQEPAAIIYSDLSTKAVANIRERFDLRPHAGRIAFAAIDAQQIPLFAETVDIVYGYAVVHHLPQLEQFLSEVIRVLAPGGRAIFMDDAYSPIWHFAKMTFLRPLMNYSHRTTGISPEDYRFSMGGGFREQALAQTIRRNGARPWFARVALFQYIWARGAEKVLPVALRRLAMHRNFARALRAIDRPCASLPLLRGNLVRLVWGLEKTFEIAS
jgi:SAM-dependent methyltransferase